eukprot:1860804-Rhodomonas_salina.1
MAGCWCASSISLGQPELPGASKPSAWLKSTPCTADASEHTRSSECAKAGLVEYASSHHPSSFAPCP